MCGRTWRRWRSPPGRASRTRRVGAHPDPREAEENARAVLENYPRGGSPKDGLDVTGARVAATEARWVKTPTFTFVRVEGTGNDGTAAFKARYPHGTVWWVIILYELRGDKVAKSTAFYAPLSEAPEWRKPYAEHQEATAKP